MNTTAQTDTSATKPAVLTPLHLLVAVIVPIGVFSGNLLPLTDTGTISNTVFARVILTPANYVFIVWAVIYLGMLALGIAQALPAGRDNPRYAKARVPLIVNMAFNFAWIVAWGSLNTPLSLLLIVGQLLSAIWIFLSLEANRSQLSRGWEGFIQFASGAYVAWLTLATVLNAACVLVYYKWDGFGIADANWVVVMMVIAALIGILEIRRWRNPAFSAVFAWAFVGIALRANQPVAVVIVAALLGLMFLALLIFNSRFFVPNPKRSLS